MTQNSGINFYFSNSYRQLAGLFTDLQKEDQDTGPFGKEYIIVQTDGMQKWLCLESAEANTVFAGFEFLGVNSFFRKLYHLLKKEQEGASVFSVRVLKWMIYKIFKQALGKEEAFSVIQAYAQGKDHRIFQLSSVMADLFEQYMIYRPEMIEAWNKGMLFCEGGKGAASPLHEKWQMMLWQYIKAFTGRAIPDRVEMRNSLLEKLSEPDSGKIIREKMGTRVSLFGFTVLPEYYLYLFERLSANIRVDFFLMNPCPSEYWFDIVDHREKYAKEKRFFLEKGMDPELLYLDTGNPLLSFFGKVGRDFFSNIFMLDSAHSKSREALVCSGCDSLLSRLKTDIHTLENRPDTGERIPFDLQDRSVRIISCYSPLREVEVLADSILEMFDTGRPGAVDKIAASDILVVMPDIETYAPYIEQVFSRFSGFDPNHPFIPYTIADRVVHGENTVAGVMKKILELPGKRAEAPEIFSVIESKPVRDAFSLKSEEISVIRGWIQQSGIRWGIDAGHREELGLPGYGEYSWKWGADRLMAGYAMEQERDRFISGIIPSDSVQGGEADLLGRFHTIVYTLFEFLAQKGHMKTGDEWAALFSSTASTLFGQAAAHEDGPGNLDMEDILVRVGRNINDGFMEKGLDSKTPLPFEVFCAEFSRYLDMPPEKDNRFLSRGITFSSMVPMRSIPFRVICMLGMNEEDFPRKNRLSEFDLIEHFPQKGDRSTRDNDLYLFLEMLLSAEDRLYISYTGKNIKDNSDIPPSRAVSHLTDYMDKNFYVKGDPDRSVTDVIHIRHPLQPFSKRYFSCNAENESLFTYRDKQYFAPDMSAPDAGLPVVRLSGDKEEEVFHDIHLDDFVRFFSDPCRFFLEKRVRAAFPAVQDPLEHRELFDENRLLDFKVKQLVVNSLLKGESPDWDLEKMKAEAQLPYGKYRNRYLADRKKEARDLVDKITSAAGPVSGLCRQELETRAAGVRIRAQSLPFVRQGDEKVLVGWHTAGKKAKYIIRAWFSLLLASACRDEDTPLRLCFVFADDVLDIPGMAQSDAADILEGLVKMYLGGLESPLVFFPASSLKFMETERKQGMEKALKAAEKTFYGDNYTRSEMDDSAHFRHFFRLPDVFDRYRAEFVANSRAVWNSFLDACGGDHG
ncbi:MAG: exodeoxyribonuclease V subunit gamma [Desulfobacteraceae bacterium]